MKTTEPRATNDADTTPDAPRRHWLVRVPMAILMAFFVTSIVLAIWAHLIADAMPAGVRNVVGPLLLFVLAPVLTGVLLRDMRWPVRIAAGLFAAWLWVFWLFLVFIPVAG